MYLGLGKSIIQFVVPPPGHGPLDILSGRQSEHFIIKWGQANLFCGHNLPPDWNRVVASDRSKWGQIPTVNRAGTWGGGGVAPLGPLATLPLSTALILIGY